MVYISVLAALAILVCPLLSRTKVDVFHPLVLFSFSFTIGGVIRTSYYVSRYPATDLPYGLSIADLKVAIVVIIVAFIVLVSGYYAKIGKRVSKIFTLDGVRRVNYNIVRYSSVVLLLIGICLFTLLFRDLSFGQVFLEISSKRNFENGYLVWGAEIIYVSFILIYTIGILGGKKKTSYRFVMFVSFVIYLSIGFFMSRRGMILKGFLIPAVIHHYGKEKIGITKVITGGACFLLLFSLMAGMRRKAFSGIYEMIEFVESKFPEEIYSSFVTGHYLFDITTVATLIRDVPKSLGFQYGKTMVTWVLMPIPRSVWPEKPTAVGQLVGANIYDQGIGKIGGGVPPPLPADLYLNFNIVGVIVGMFVFGIFVRIAYSLVTDRDTSFLSLITYSLLLTTLISMFNGGFSKPIVGFLKLYIPALMVYIVSLFPK